MSRITRCGSFASLGRLLPNERIRMDDTYRQQHGQSAHQQDHAPCIPGKPLELDSEAGAE
jgi:hypothetical protein